MQRLSLLKQNPTLLDQINRGIEREALRIDKHGDFAMTAHPQRLGSALTHAHITTDYSESLLELITDPHHSVPTLLEQLAQIHQFTLQNMGNESIWMQSMPCHLPSEEKIPIAEYGPSNSGQLRHVYRKGLALRYGRKMQCIAGLHYNFSLPESFWTTLDFEGKTAQDKQTNGYMAMIRNFKRYAWLLMYCFGASPALNASFLNDTQKSLLEKLDDESYYLPYATSLRMSDLGYHNDAQSNLQSCYNDLAGFSNLIYNAVTTSWPAYEKLGTQDEHGQWIQLNTNILQIENEFYANIRPKRTIGRGERPITALMQKGVQYIEVRCIDIDPQTPLGISESTCYFLDTFLLYCALKDSPLFPGCGICTESEDNFNLVVNQGRQPGLRLSHHAKSQSLQDWGLTLLDEMGEIANILDVQQQCTCHNTAISTQRRKLNDPELTPSAIALNRLKAEGLSFNELNKLHSLAGSDELRFTELALEVAKDFQAQSEASLAQQAQIEASDSICFKEYVDQFMHALKHP